MVAPLGGHNTAPSTGIQEQGPGNNERKQLLNYFRRYGWQIKPFLRFRVRLLLFCFGFTQEFKSVHSRKGKGRVAMQAQSDQRRCRRPLLLQAVRS